MQLNQIRFWEYGKENLIEKGECSKERTVHSGNSKQEKFSTKTILNSFKKCGVTDELDIDMGVALEIFNKSTN